MDFYLLTGEQNSIDNLTFSFCFEKEEKFLFQNLNYNKKQERQLITDFRSLIEFVNVFGENWENHTTDDIVFNRTKIFFKNSCICYQIQLFFHDFYSQFNKTNLIYITYFLLPKNSVIFKFNKTFSKFYITKNYDLPYFAEPFYSEHYFTMFQTIELPSPFRTSCISYAKDYKEDFEESYTEKYKCKNQGGCYQKCLFIEHFKQNKSIINHIVYTVEQYGHYFDNRNLSDLNLRAKINTGIDYYCWNKTRRNNCMIYAYFPVKEKASADTKQFSMSIFLNYFYFKIEHIENYSLIEMFFSFMSLVYLFTGVSFIFLLRKLNYLIKGKIYRLIYSFGIILLQGFMIWQIQTCK